MVSGKKEILKRKTRFWGCFMFVVFKAVCLNRFIFLLKEIYFTSSNPNNNNCAVASLVAKGTL